MDLSIVIPILDDHQRFLQNYAEYATFFKKFGIQFELLVVCNDKSSYRQIEEQIKADAAKSIDSLIRVFLNSTNKSRCGAVSHGILNSQGKIIVISTADQMTPLASYFAALQAFLSDSDLHLLSGNRLDPKRPAIGEKSAVQIQRVENYNRFFKEIYQLNTVDPTTPFLALRNNSKTQSIAKKMVKINSWYYSPFWLYAFGQEAHQILEISIQETCNPQSKFRPFKDNFLIYWAAILNR